MAFALPPTVLAATGSGVVAMAPTAASAGLATPQVQSSDPVYRPAGELFGGLIGGGRSEALCEGTRRGPANGDESEVKRPRGEGS